MSLIIRETEGAVGILTLNSEANLNAYNLDLGREFLSHVYDLSGDGKIRCVVITGAGKAFSAGGDVKFMVEAAQSEGEMMRMLIAYLHGTITEIRRMGKPVISAVNGIAAGAGIGLALSADLVYASRDASFHLAYQNIGLTPDGGATTFLTKQLGYHRTMELMLTGKPLMAEEAKSLGLVNSLFEGEELMGAVREIAQKISCGPTLAFSRGKELFQKAFMEHMETQLELERQNILKQSETRDFIEGIRAFVEKRPPRFEGK